MFPDFPEGHNSPEWKPVPCTITRVVYDPPRGPESSYEKRRELSWTVATGMVDEKKQELQKGRRSSILVSNSRTRTVQSRDCTVIIH
jgi:hypothetical protein